MSEVLRTPVESHEISLIVNGEKVLRRVAARHTLADFLREELRLTGTHLGCEHGVCGACTILVDDLPVRSCLVLAIQVDGKRVETVESLSNAGDLSPMQDAFRRMHALQCGFCTPGFLMTLKGADPQDYPTDESIRELLSGNICRCTGYHNIVRAVRFAWGREVVDAESGVRADVESSDRD